MNRLASSLVFFLCLVLSVSAKASLVSEYTFDSGYQDEKGNGPDLISNGGDIVGGEYLFRDGKGVQLSLPDGESYAIEVAFNYNALDSYKYGAFMSFGSVKESQLYIVDRKLVYYGYGQEFRTGPEFFAKENIVFGLSRSASGEFSYYLNGAKLLSSTDGDGGLIADGDESLVSFFIDNTTENISGSISYIKTYSQESGLLGDKSISDVSGPLVSGFGFLCLIGTAFGSRREKLLVK